jgi:hypothetical protein
MHDSLWRIGGRRAPKRTRLFFPLVLLVLAAVLPAATRASATISLGTSSCAVVDSNANCVPGPFRDVQTTSVNGVEIERASATGVFNDTGRAVIFTFASFGAPFGYCVSDVTGRSTAEWVETLTPSGNATIVCRFRS